MIEPVIWINPIRSGLPVDRVNDLKELLLPVALRNYNHDVDQYQL